MTRPDGRCIKMDREGFTLVEIILAITLVSIVSMVTYGSFSTALTAWRRGTALMDDLHHGDFVMEQLASGLRSTYYPDGSSGCVTYGFVHHNHGNGPYSSDEIGWVKIGGALVGQTCPFAGSPHRVWFRVHESPDGGREATVRAWAVVGQPEHFDPDTVERIPLSRRVVGFDCRAAFRKRADSDEIDWEDEWKDTNRVPTAVELTLYVQAASPAQDPVAIKRIVGVPVGALAWR